MGLSQIIEANENPTAYAKQGLTDGQRRRNDDPGNAFWSEAPTVEEQIKSPVGTFVSNPNEFSPADDDGRMMRAARSHERLNMDNQPLHYFANAQPFTGAYFDGVRMLIALREQRQELYRQSQVLEEAMTAVRAGYSETNLIAKLAEFSTTDLRVRMEVNTLASQIDIIAPEPKGYTKHMGIQYALRPLKDTITRLRSYLAMVGG